MAPLMEMYLWSDGLVAACRRKREQAFGYYPKESLSQIWRSAVRQRLALDLANDILPDGCSRGSEQVIVFSDTASS